jgi:hypothetical protein
MIKIRLSKRKHLPVLQINNSANSFPFWKYRTIKKIEASGLSLDSLGESVLISELPTGIYTPPFNLAGKTVLDIGATDGETAYWFMHKHNAKKVICIECDEKRLVHLRKNKAVLGNIEVIAERFKLEHLRNLEYDFIKCDVEGYEMVLIDFINQGNILKPCVLEAHSSWIKDQFLNKGFKVTKARYDEIAGVEICIMNNY